MGWSAVPSLHRLGVEAMIVYANEICHSAVDVIQFVGSIVTNRVQRSNCQALWVRLEPQTAFHLSLFPRLKYLLCPCTDVSHIDLAECKRRNIRVLSLRDTEVLPTITATAEHTIGLILALVRKIPSAVESTNRGEWDRSGFMGREISSLRPAVIGYGRIGKMVCEILEAMGGVVDWTGKYCPTFGIGDYDLVSVHVDLNDSTRGMCNSEFFAAMKPGAYFINTSRGQVVDESALLDALCSGHLAGAALDVVQGEPDGINQDLVKFANEEPGRLLMTPHVGGYCRESLEKAETALAKKLIEVIGSG